MVVLALRGPCSRTATRIQLRSREYGEVGIPACLLGRSNHEQSSRRWVSNEQKRENEWLTDYAADCKEPNHDGEDILEPSCIFSDDAVDRDQLQELQTDVEIKNSADTDGTEKANKQSLLLFFYLPNLPVQGEDDWHTAEEKDQDPEED